MSIITLKPLDDHRILVCVDDGQKAVKIPVGKTTIGRGPLLGCSDKKVSRNHAVLEVTSKGEVYLTPTHVNPCFYQPTADTPGQILKKGLPHKLENGDSFSLLPRAFRYQLIVTGENAEEKSDQNDLNKQSGKTNGAAGDCEEALSNERNKEAKSGKGISNEALNDGNMALNNEKCETNSDSKSEAMNEEKKVDSENDKDNADEAESKKDRVESKSNETCTKDKNVDEKIVEEDSTLGNDSFPKDKAENDHNHPNDKSDTESSKDKLESKKTDDVSNGDDNLDVPCQSFLDANSSLKMFFFLLLASTCLLLCKDLVIYLTKCI